MDVEIMGSVHCPAHGRITYPLEACTLCPQFNGIGFSQTGSVIVSCKFKFRRNE